MPTIPDETLRVVHRLNRAYLHAARDGLRAGQQALVESLFGLDASMSGWLLAASPEAIEQLATLPGTLFQARLPAAAEPLLRACAEEPVRDVAEMHLLLHQLSNGEQAAAGPGV